MNRLPRTCDKLSATATPVGKQSHQGKLQRLPKRQKTSQ